MKNIFIDVETTGVDFRESEIIQISAIIEIDGEVIDTFDSYMKPIGEVGNWDWLESVGFPVHEIEHFPSSADVKDRFIKFLSKYCDKYDKKDKYQFIAYNSRFDEDFVRVWLSDDKYLYGSYFWTVSLDVMNMAVFFLQSIRSKLPNMKLATICKLYDIALDAHDASADIKATRELYHSLTESDC